MLDTATQVRDLAYQLWMEQGCPLGRDKENWFEAERLLNQTQHEALPKKAKKAQEKKSKAKRK